MKGLTITKRTLWMLKGRGAWEVRDYSKEIIYLFKTKREAKEFADERIDLEA